jgi:hypothetical protein
MKRLVPFSALAISALAVVYVWFASSFWGGLFGLTPPLILKQPGYLAVVKDLKSGRLVIGTKPRLGYWHGTAPKNQVDLPPSYQSIAPKVYAERRPDGRLFVLFATWLGRGADLNGYLYCSRPLTPGDFFPADWGSGGVRQQIHLCGISYLEPQHIRGPWYRVLRRLD